MKIQFDSQQQYQLDAVNAVVDVFDGPLQHGMNFSVYLESIKATKTKITAKLTIDIQQQNSPTHKNVLISKNEVDLYELSGGRDLIDNMLLVNHSIYDAIEFQSDTERQFAEVLDGREDIKLFIKLPPWFKVQTPLGTYNPDWAIVKQVSEDEPKLYLIRETKGTTDPLKRREGENAKISCGRKHFDSLKIDFDDLSFEGATNALEV